MEVTTSDFIGAEIPHALVVDVSDLTFLGSGEGEGVS